MNEAAVKEAVRLLELYRLAQKVCVYDTPRLWKQTPESEAAYKKISDNIDNILALISKDKAEAGDKAKVKTYIAALKANVLQEDGEHSGLNRLENAESIILNFIYGRIKFGCVTAIVLAGAAIWGLKSCDKEHGQSENNPTPIEQKANTHSGFYKRNFKEFAAAKNSSAERS